MKFINNIKESKSKVVAIALIIVGISILFGVAIFGREKELVLEIDKTLLVFVEEDATNKEIKQLKKDLKSVENVIDYDYKSKDEPLKEVKGNNAVLNQLFGELPENPVSAYFIVVIEDTTLISATANEIRKLESVDNVSFSKELQDKYADFIQGIT